MRTCSVEGCERALYARGQCHAHWLRLVRGSPAANQNDTMNLQGKTWLGYSMKRNPAYVTLVHLKSHRVRLSGEQVSERWKGRNAFRNFLEDVGERPVNSSLVRIDTSKPWEPGNVKWVSKAELLLLYPPTNGRSDKWRGVVKLKGGRFTAQVHYQKRRRRIGVFDTVEEAQAARQAYIQKILAADRKKREIQP